MIRRRSVPATGPAPLRELWVVLFACGAYRAERTRIGAEAIEFMHSERSTCCARGGCECKVVRFVPNALRVLAGGKG